MSACWGFPCVSALHHIVGPGWGSCSPELQHGNQPQSCVFLELHAIPLGRVQGSQKGRDEGHRQVGRVGGSLLSYWGMWLEGTKPRMAWLEMNPWLRTTGVCLTMLTRSIGFAMMTNWWSHVLSCFITTLFRDGNSNLNCGNKSKTTCNVLFDCLLPYCFQLFFTHESF